MRTVFYSPDKSRILTTSLGNEATLWDWDLTHPTGVPLLHTNKILRAWFTSDSRKIVTEGENSTLWDATTRQAISHAFPLTNLVSSLFSPDGRRFAGFQKADEAGKVFLRIWNAGDSTPIGQPIEFGKLPSDYSFSPDGKVLAVVGQNAGHAWDTGDRRLLLGPIALDPGSASTFSPRSSHLFFHREVSRAWSENPGTAYVVGRFAFGMQTPANPSALRFEPGIRSAKPTSVRTVVVS